MYSSKPGLLIAFHGCDKHVCQKIVVGKWMLKPSQNDYDWLGHGMYFWEGNEQRALDFVRELKERPASTSITTPAVLGAVIDMGDCLDLLDSQCLNLLKKAYTTLEATYKLLNLPLPVNVGVGGSKDLLLRKLDCAVIEVLHSKLKVAGLKPFDSVRGVFIEGAPLYPNAGFNEKNHIQICILNPNCIKGFFIPRLSDENYSLP